MQIALHFDISTLGLGLGSSVPFHNIVSALLEKYTLSVPIYFPLNLIFMYWEELISNFSCTMSWKMLLNTELIAFQMTDLSCSETI